MGLLKQRKNKKFSYTPRYYDDKGKGSPFKIKNKFDDFRKTVGGNTSLKSKFVNAFAELKNDSDKKSNKLIFIIVAVLVFIFLAIIDFDLSIFFSN